MAQRHNGITS